MTKYVTIDEHLRLAQALAKIANLCKTLNKRIADLEKHNLVVDAEFRTILTQLDQMDDRMHRMRRDLMNGVDILSTAPSYPEDLLQYEEDLADDMSTHIQTGDLKILGLLGFGR